MTCLAAVVVFCTTYALILPAITMEKQCEIPEHTHSEACYTQVTDLEKQVPVCSRDSLELHSHTESCYDGDRTLICGYADFVVHTHDSACYDENGVLWCPLPEIKAHTHTEDCYAPVHEHTENCYEWEPGELICAEEEREGHTHSEDSGCYAVESTCVCDIPESAGHQHSDSCYTETQVCGMAEGDGAHTHEAGCYDADGNLICGQAESAGHVHSDGCWQKTLVCETPEGDGGHTHGESCFEVTKTLICEIPEDPGHTHSDDCYEQVQGGLICGEPTDTEPEERELICEKEEILLHEHTSECFDKDGNLICGKIQVLEHRHTVACFETVEEPVDTETLTCGKTEGEGAHTHGEGCYDENGELICQTEESEGHVHTALCYGTWILTCGMEEHTHTEECMPAAELEGTCFCGKEAHSHTDECYSADGALICGLEAHTHSIACYSNPSADLETAADWEASLPDQLSGEWSSDVIAIAQSQIDYCESAQNYIVWEDGTTHGYTRYGEWYGVPHGDWCGMFVSFCLHYAGVEDIPLDFGCRTWIAALSDETYNLYRSAEDESFIPRPGDLVFFDWEGDGLSDHVGLVAEIIPASGEEPAKLKTIEGNSGDQVRYHVYEQNDPVLLGYGMLPEQVFYCGRAGHVHSDLCQGICGLEEHIHTDSCEQEPIEPVQLSCSGDGYTICVEYGPDAQLPEGVTLTATEIPQTSEEYKAYYAQAAQAVGEEEEVVFARFFDISFQLDGVAYEPAAPVSVTITYTQTVKTGDEEACQAVHFTEDGTELLDVITQQEEDGATSFTHTQDSFSVVGNVVLRSVQYNPSDNGPDKLLVDYYVCIDNEWVCAGSTKTGWYFSWDGEEDWTDYNRDYISVAQAQSVLGDYGFTGEEANPSALLAYQKKTGGLSTYADTNTVEIGGQKVLPLSRTYDHSGYNLYYLPANETAFSGTPVDSLDKTANGFFTVKLYDGSSQLAYSQVVRSGGSFNYDATSMGVESWIVSRVGRGTWRKDSTTVFDIADIVTPVLIYPVDADAGTAVTKSVTFRVMIDGEWQTVGSLPYFYYKDFSAADGTSLKRAYITSTMAAQFLEKFGFTATEDPAYQFGFGYSGGKIYNNSPSFAREDGTYDIPLVTVSDENNINEFLCYYLPAETNSWGKGLLETDVDDDNGFWSVSVVDNTHSIYTELELRDMVQYVPSGAEATVTVLNADEVLWSCRGVNGKNLDVTMTQEAGMTTFVIHSITQPVEVTATAANPSFTVQYYANVQRLATSGGDVQLPVIDTSAAANGGTAKLPSNGVTPVFRQLQLVPVSGVDKSVFAGNSSRTNRGTQTQIYEIKTNLELTKLYTSGLFQYESAPSLEYFNKLRENTDYILSQIWVLKPGCSADSTQESDWTVYSYAENTSFTNEAGQAQTDETILIEDGAVIRLVFDTTSGRYVNNTTFYDYNISSGKNSSGQWLTGTAGINSSSNYGTSEDGYNTWSNYNAILAFGNNNCGTGMAASLFKGGELNKRNTTNSNAYGCTFGLAEKLNSDGTINYHNYLLSPKLFNDGDAVGKQTYPGSSLTFTRKGDAYTLSWATLKRAGGDTRTIKDLAYFANPSPTSSTVWSNIYTNEFWPMDDADSSARTDANWGAYGSPGSFYGYKEGSLGTVNSAEFPDGDNGYAHNWFFGMNFALSFNLEKDYEGPLEYYFFGDDDLWVFLDNRLICDIGGVHSSVGEYVDLRDYLPIGSEGQHTLSFFYTERGASGSTCYMSFILPSVSSATTAQNTGSLQIQKAVNSAAGGDFSGESYQFHVELLTGENGTPLEQTFSYSLTDGTTTNYYTVKSGQTITMKAGQTATIRGIPAGTYYRVTETEESRKGYSTTVNNGSGYIASGTVASGSVHPASFVNTPFCELPSTGGTGTELYTIGGMLLIAAAGILLYIQSKRKRGHASVS